jgi:hypothetical protein
MNRNDWDRIWSRLAAFVQPFAQRLRPYRWWLVGIAAGCLILPPVVEYYRGKLGREIVVLSGPPGSSGANLAERLKNELEQVENEYRVPYRVKLIPTHGAEEIARLLAEDATGRTVGFQFDSFADTDRLRTVYPMDYDFLHVLGRAEFVRKHWPETAATVRDLDAFLQVFTKTVRESQARGDVPTAVRRVFPGPSDSACRIFAAQALKLYGLDVDEVSHHGVHDWKQAQVALQKGDVDLVFFLGPKNADMIAGIAADETAVLLDLKDVAAAMIDKTTYSTWPGAFPPNSYRGETLAVQAAAVTPIAFCPGLTQTVATRRLLACHANMSDNDAYAVMIAADRAFGGDGPAAGMWDSPPPATVSQPLRTGFGIAKHGVADLFLNNRRPAAWWWPTTWSTMTWGAALSLGLFLLETVLTRLSTPVVSSETGPAKAAEVMKTPEIPDNPPPDLDSPDRKAYLADVEDALDAAMRRVPRRDSRGTLDDWHAVRDTIDRVRMIVRQAQDQGRISVLDADRIEGRCNVLERAFQSPVGPGRKGAAADSTPASR